MKQEIIIPRWTPEQLKYAIKQLNSTQFEIAKYLKISVRTVNRWTTGKNKIYGPAQEAIKAWIKLENAGISWRKFAEASLVK